MWTTNSIITVGSFGLAFLIVLYTAKEYRLLRERVAALIQAINALQKRAVDLRGKASNGAALELTELAAMDEALSSAWRDYRAGFVQFDGGDSLRSRAPASDFFGGDLPYRHGLDLRRFDALPNLLIGVGLLITFAGLAASIAIAQVGIGGGARETIAALHSLLAAAAFKFVTSIAAIGAALVFGKARNTLYNRLDGELADLCRTLDLALPPITDLLFIEAARAELEIQTGLLDRDLEQQAQMLEDAVDRAMGRHLAAALLPVATAIESMGVHLGSQNIDALRQMVDVFAKRLGSAAREHTDQLVGLLDHAGRAMQDAPASIGKAAEAFGALIDEESRAFGRRVAGATANLNEALGNSREVLAALTKQAGDLHAGLVKTEQALLNRVIELDSRTHQMGAVFDLSVSKIHKITEEDGPLDTASRRLAQAAETLAEGMRDARAFGDAGNAAARSLAEHAGEFDKQIANLDGHIANVVERLADGFAASRVNGAIMSAVPSRKDPSSLGPSESSNLPDSQ